MYEMGGRRRDLIKCLCYWSGLIILRLLKSLFPVCKSRKQKTLSLIIVSIFVTVFQNSANGISMSWHSSVCFCGYAFLWNLNWFNKYCKILFRLSDKETCDSFQGQQCSEKCLQWARMHYKCHKYSVCEITTEYFRVSLSYLFWPRFNSVIDCVSVWPSTCLRELRLECSEVTKFSTQFPTQTTQLWNFLSFLQVPTHNACAKHLLLLCLLFTFFSPVF